MDVSQVVLALSEKLNLSLQDVQNIKGIYNSIDTAALKEAEKSKYKIVPWTPGMKASTGVLFEDVFPELKDGGHGYAIFVDGQLVIFQAHDPRTGSPMKDAETRDAAAAWHVEQLAEDQLARLVEAEVLKRV